MRRRCSTSRSVERLFVDGRAASLEAQALQPLVHPDEMANAGRRER